MNARQRAALDKLAEYAGKLEQLERDAAIVRRRIEGRIRRAVELGVPSSRVAEVAGVTPARVSQIAPRATVSDAQKTTPAASRVTPAATVADELPRLAAAAPLLSGVSSTRQRTRYGKPTVFLPMEPVAKTLALVGSYDSGSSVRVYLTGGAPADAHGATGANATRGWALGGELPEGWRVDERGHYLADADLPVLRFRHDGGRRVVIMRAASWWGETDATPDTCSAAWDGLERALEQTRAFAGAGIADTPATAGRALWRRTIAEGAGWPVMSDELRELIAATSGQGRIELLPAPKGSGRRDFTYLDGRLMYAALVWGMPVGEPSRWTAGQLERLEARQLERTIRGRGRWLVRATVPAGWDHVGMLPRLDAGGWSYPAAPGETFTSWVDGAEAWLAMSWGWDVELLEGITWREGKPLERWRDELLAIHARAAGSGSEAGRLAARAVRSLILYTIGAFASRAHESTGSAPADRPELVPAGHVPGSVTRAGDQLVWQMPGELSSWALEAAHPEWSATVWARSRTRLLSGRGAGEQLVGALHLDRRDVVAMSTDALYVAGDPGWADDGKPGRFRVKGQRPGRFAWPATRPELFRLRDEAEAATEGETS